MYNQGIHARSGRRLRRLPHALRAPGALKVSDHHVRSPLLNLDQACQTCHKVSEQELRERVYAIQDRTFEIRNIAIDALLDLISGIERARGADSADPGSVWRSATSGRPSSMPTLWRRRTRWASTRTRRRCGS